MVKRSQKGSPGVTIGRETGGSRVSVFIDNTLTDVLGRQPCEAVLISLANICERKRRSPNAWSLLGIVPAYPKSKQERAAERNSEETSSRQPNFYHDCLRIIFGDLLEHEQSQLGHEVYVPCLGQIVYVHFKLIFFDW